MEADANSGRKRSKEKGGMSRSPDRERSIEEGREGGEGRAHLSTFTPTTFLELEVELGEEA